MTELAHIESSKAWARRFVDEYGTPGNPADRVFEDRRGLPEHLESLDEFVVKLDGLTGGKGVRVYPEHFDSLRAAISYAADALADGFWTGGRLT